MKSNNIFISILVFVCFALYVALELKLPCKDVEIECRANTKRLETMNDSLQEQNKKLDKKYQVLELKADSLKEKLSSIKQTIVQLKNKQYEKVNAIDTLTNDELYSFFAEFETESSVGK